MAKGGGKKDELQPIIIKRVKKVAGGHHGGAWKVAYADFVTAMMAFFLLLWLLNVAVQDKLETISNYFDPSFPRISSAESGSGGVMGGLTMSPDGAQVSTVQPLVQPDTTGKNSQGEAREEPELSQYDEQTLEKLEQELRQQEDRRFEEAKQELEEMMKKDAQLAELAKNLMVDITPEGLRIQIVDQEGKPMFPSGSAEMFDRARLLMTKVGEVVRTMPNQASVRGHTDSNPYPPGAKYTNWELSADRANASRRVLLDTGIPETQMANVMGKSDREHLIKEVPSDPRNRRISIIMLREEMKDAIERGAFGARTPQPVRPAAPAEQPIG
ncbi:MAG: flagellar motor protein MotB, partial [Alphaproteobacteria bacterium]|nr:flagellar motor protein MotB [Alphaproteobacteria bacterium]